jgi:DNA-binding NtrC family response regulator
MSSQEVFTVLVVDDQEVVSMFATAALQRNGYKVLVASSGHEGLRCFTEHQATINLVISDVVMPQMSGYKMVEAIRVMRPNVSVIFMTGTADAMPRWVSDSCAVLRKPFMTREFISVVEHSLESSRKPAGMRL